MSPRNSSVLTRWSVAALAVMAVGATPVKKSALKGAPTQSCKTFADPPAQFPSGSKAVEVTFLGVGGLLIRWDGQSIMTPPLYSNPTMGEVALSELYPDGERIDRLLHYPLGDLKAILVGHAHYDHALDVPYIASKKASQAWIYGSQTLVNILDPLKGAVTLKNAEDRAMCKVTTLLDPCPPASPTSCDSAPCAGSHSFDIPEVAAPHFRIWPIVSEHSAPLGPELIKSVLGAIPAGILQAIVPIDPVVGWRGQLLAPAPRIPTRAGDWTGGTILAYVIDLLDTTTNLPVFRIYYQDSPTRKHIGYPPCCLTNQKRIDLALLCAGGATEKPIKGKFPGDIVKELRPQFVIAEHWEDLFNPRGLPVPGQRNVAEKTRAAPGVKPDKFKSDVVTELPTRGRVTVPCPEDVAYFVPDPSHPNEWMLHSNTVGTWTPPKP
jgi:hypothetical protein